MNNDRFLTRVWDKQEKVMIYEGDTKQNFSLDAIIHGINSAGLIQEIAPKLNDNFDEAEVKIIPFGDRFVPMMCYGKRDKNDKPLYDNDILQEKTGHTYCLEFDGTEWMVRYIKYNVEYKGQKMPAPYTPWGCMWGGTDKIDDEIIGNRWEHPELLEANE